MFLSCCMHQNCVYERKSILTQKLTNMSTNKQSTQVTCRFNTNQDPNERTVAYAEYKYDNKEKKKICNPNGSKGFP